MQPSLVVCVNWPQKIWTDEEEARVGLEVGKRFPSVKGRLTQEAQDSSDPDELHRFLANEFRQQRMTFLSGLKKNGTDPGQPASLPRIPISDLHVWRRPAVVIWVKTKLGGRFIATCFQRGNPYL